MQFGPSYTLCKHPMQIWRTTPSLPGTSCMKARLDGPQCFFKQRSLRKALLHWQSSLFYFAMPMSFLNATRWDRNCPVFASKGKMYIHTIHQDKASEFMIAAGTEICLLHFQVGSPLIENCLNDSFIRWCSNTISMACTFPKEKKNLPLKVA